MHSDAAGIKVPTVTEAEQRKFRSFYQNIEAFVNDTLAGHLVTLDNVADFIPGSEPLLFYEEYVREASSHLEDYREEFALYGGLSHEEALFHRLTTERPFNLLILIGGLGAGKSTAMHYIRRLFRDRKADIDARFPCSCTCCQREPIYFNLREFDRKFDSEQAIHAIYKQIRMELFERLISEWLCQNQVDAKAVKSFDPGYKVLRRLMLVNDLQDWAQNTYPGDYPLAFEIEGFTTEPLFQRTSLSLSSLEALVARYEPESARVAAQIDKIIEKLNSAAAYTSLLLRFYAARCARWKPSSLLILDNLDQLPTDTIDKIMGQLSFLASKGQVPPFVVPLRPSSLSSLAPKAFEHLPSYMRHYGPNCFELVLHRLAKYVLQRSSASLTEPDTTGALPKVFVKAPTTQDELYAFLVATYLYAKMAAAGLRDQGSRVTGGTRPLLEPHQDFAERLEQMRIPDGALVSLSQTIGALVGTSARYGMEQLKQYYRSIYLHPDTLAAVLRAGIALNAPTALHLRYKQIINTILSHPEPGEPERIANIYKPTEEGAHPEFPSLVKIRLLVELESRNRATVRQLLRNLARYGIPRELVIRGLNYLQHKHRLLVWFTKNSELLEDDTDLDQYVTIAEHGLSYVRHVIGDFEYIWFCAGGIPPRSPADLDSNFRARLEEYTRLMQAFALTEWKQLAFVRCIERDGVEENAIINSHRMLTLLILYSSLERAIVSARVSLRGALRKSSYHQHVASLVARLCKLILESQGRYRKCYGDTGYLKAYEKLLLKNRHALHELRGQSVLDHEQEALVHEVLQSWDEQLEDLPAAHEGVELILPPDENFVSLCATFSRGLIPNLSEMLPRLASSKDQSYQLLKVYLWEFLREREQLVGLLERRLPLYSLVRKCTASILGATRRVNEAIIRVESALPATIEWFAREEVWLESQLNRLRSNSFHLDDLNGFDEIGVARLHVNDLLDVFRDIAHRSGATSVEHLNVEWH